MPKSEIVFKKRIYGIKKLHANKAYLFYKENYTPTDPTLTKHHKYKIYNNTKDRKHKCANIAEWKKIHKAIWKEVSDQIYKSEAGVYIKRLGYFAIIMNPEVKVLQYAEGYLKTYSDHTEGHDYHMTFFADVVRNNKFKYWGMDRGYSITLRRKVKDQLLKGFKYQLKYTLLKKVLLNSNPMTYADLTRIIEDSKKDAN